MFFTEDGLVTLFKVIVMIWAKIVVFDGDIRLVNVMVVWEVPVREKVGDTVEDMDVFALNVDESTVKVTGNTISIIINPVWLSFTSTIISYLVTRFTPKSLALTFPE